MQFKQVYGGVVETFGVDGVGGGSHFLQKQTLPERLHGECDHLHCDDSTFLQCGLIFLWICFVVLLLERIGLDCVKTFNYLLARVGPPALQITIQTGSRFLHCPHTLRVKIPKQKFQAIQHN